MSGSHSKSDMRRPYPRLRSPGGPPRLRLPARDRPRRRPPVHLRGARRGGARAPSSRSASATRAAAASSPRWTSTAPEGIESKPVERLVEQLPPALVDLALWLADYYGSTPARALGLVAPHAPKRRGERRHAVSLGALEPEAPPEHLSEPQERALARIEELLARRRRPRPARGRDRQRQDGGLHPRLRGRARARPRRDRARAGDRAHAADARPLPGPLRRPRRRPPLGALRGRAARRARADRDRGDARRRRRALGGLRARARARPVCVDEEHDASYKQESDPRYDARTVAAKRAALEGAVAVFGSATPRPESWHALERLSLGGRINAPMPTVRVVDLRREAGYPLSAPLLAELGGIAERGGKAILLLNRRGLAPAAPLPRLRGDPPLPQLRRRARRCIATARSAATTAAPSRSSARRCPACGSGEVARIGAGTQRLEAELAAARPRARADPPRRRRGREAGAAPRRARAVLPRRPRRAARDADGREGPSLPRRRARRGDRRRHRPRPAGLPRRGAHLPAPHPARRAQRPRRARTRARPDLPARRARRHLRRPPRRRRLPRRRARPPARARLPAVPAPRADRRLRARAPRRAARARGAEGGAPRRGAARPGAAAAATEPAARPARRQDGAAACVRDAGGRPARRGRARDAPRRPHRGRRRRPAESARGASAMRWKSTWSRQAPAMCR